MKQISFAKPSKSVQHDTLVLDVETQNWNTKGSLMKQISFAKPSKSVQNDTLILDVETQNWNKVGLKRNVFQCVYQLCFCIFKRMFTF